jgi:sodium pump decarboxylase gamma subunit
MGETLVRALLNTLMGMGTVFIVLIFISFIISLLKYIPKLVDSVSGRSKEKAEVPIQTSSAPAAPVAEEEELTDDLELVAVITAAVAASSGSSTDGLVVRSIKRVNNSKWRRA